jgi:hypothetical protein
MKQNIPNVIGMYDGVKGKRSFNFRLQVFQEETELRVRSQLDAGKHVHGLCLVGIQSYFQSQDLQ